VTGTAAAPRTGIWLFPSRPAADLVALAEAIEAAGLDELWLGDEGPARDPFAVLAAAAVRTERLTLGIGITSPYLRLPAVTAATALTLQELSGGRAILGFGTGGAYALGPVGIRPKTPFGDTERAVRTARAVTRRESGEGYAPPEHAIPAQPLPLYLGSRGERLNRFASREADGALVGGVPLGLLDRVVGWARSERDIAVTLCLNVAADAADREARRPGIAQILIDAPAFVREHFGIALEALRAATAALERGDEGPARAIVTDAVLDEYVIAGDDAAVEATLVQLARRHRPTSIILALLGEDPGALLPAAAARLGALRAAAA
jgi:5,10-methylenetetrahydromethanopterin reductase